MQLHLDHNEAWGDATLCAIYDALESGQGKSLKEVGMNGTGLGSVGYQRMIQAIRAGFNSRPLIRFLGCNIPELRGRPFHDSLFPMLALRLVLGECRRLIQMQQA